MLIPINVTETSEPRPVPVGRYGVTIADANEATSKNGKPQLVISVGIDGHDDAPNVRHYISLPADGDEPRSSQFKSLMLKRFLTAFKIPFSADGFNVEDFFGATATLEIGLDKEKDSDGNEKPDGAVYNRLVLPKLHDEGDVRTTGGAPKPPKR